jgi:hypothetical protein
MPVTLLPQKMKLSFEKPSYHMKGYYAVLQRPELFLEKSFPLILIQVGVRVHPEQDGVHEHMPESIGSFPVLQSCLHLPVKTQYQCTL